jgi:hypothetical protein
LNGTVAYSPRISVGSNFVTSAGQTVAYVGNSTGKFLTSGRSAARILRADIPVSNGVVHVRCRFMNAYRADGSSLIRFSSILALMPRQPLQRKLARLPQLMLAYLPIGSRFHGCAGQRDRCYRCRFYLHHQLTGDNLWRCCLCSASRGELGSRFRRLRLHVHVKCEVSCDHLRHARDMECMIMMTIPEDTIDMYMLRPDVLFLGL